VAHGDALRRNGSEEPEWSLRNGGCGDGLPCEAENEGRGKLNQVSWLEWSGSGMKATLEKRHRIKRIMAVSEKLYEASCTSISLILQRLHANN